MIISTNIQGNLDEGILVSRRTFQNKFKRKKLTVNMSDFGLEILVYNNK